MTPLCYFKTQKAYDRQNYWAPEIALVAAECIAFAQTIGVACPIITESVTTIEEDKAVKREHDQHRTRVAFDLRVNDMSGEQIDAILAHLNETFKDMAYVTSKGEKLIAFCHDNGNGYHCHAAVNARFKLPEFKEGKLG